MAKRPFRGYSWKGKNKSCRVINGRVYRHEELPLGCKDGRFFHSMKEAKHYVELCLLERCGEISLLMTQPPFDLVVNGIKITRYVGDFSFVDKQGAFHVRDVKGPRTPEYEIKRLLMQAVLGITVEEV